MTCRRCGKALPALAIQHGDGYCSTRCCQQDHGIDAAAVWEQWDQRRFKSQSTTAAITAASAFDRLRRAIRQE